jgi:hypothetical protein
MKKHLSFLALATTFLFSYSQENTLKEEFNSEIPVTDRGTYTRTGNNINKGLQVELGFDYQWLDSEESAFKTDVMSPIQAKLRLGLSKHVELDFAISNKQMIVKPWNEAMGGTDKYNYWSPLEIGLRTQFIDSKKKCDVDASLYLGLAVNTTQRSAFDDNGTLRPWVLANRPSYVAPELALFIDHNLGKRFELGYNAGLKWTGIVLDTEASSKNPDIFYTVRVLYHVAKPFDLYVEHFNFMRKDYYSTLGMNFGARYGVTKKLVLDLNGGFGFNSASPDGFAGLGLSYKLGK